MSGFLVFLKFENRLSRKTGGRGVNILYSWRGCLLEMSEKLSLIVHSFHLGRKINRQTNRQTNKPLSFDCVHKPGGLITFARGADIVLRFAKIYPQ